MELVLLERRFEQPIEFDEIQKLENAGAWSLDTHDVRLLKTFFSKDRRRMLCLYEAPDAAAVRLAEDQAKVPYDRAWTCKVIQSKEPSSDVSAKEYVVAERVFRSPVTEDFVSSALCTGSWCLDLYRLSHVESFLGNDGLKMVCVFRAPDAESVRNFSDRVSVPYTDVWTASLRKT
jgi:hypothetical protein